MTTLRADTPTVNGAWLFIRGTASVRVERQPESEMLVVSGPGAKREYRTFRTIFDLAVFMAEFESLMRREGWAVELFYTERRRRRPSGARNRGRRLNDPGDTNHPV